MKESYRDDDDGWFLILFFSFDDDDDILFDNLYKDRTTILINSLNFFFIFRIYKQISKLDQINAIVDNKQIQNDFAEKSLHTAWIHASLASIYGKL